jgi:regulator of PEP synthase PpsR (kinase-PPPase family)
MKTILALFDGLTFKRYLWSLIKTKHQVDNVLRLIEKRPGIVICTITNQEHLKQIKEFCAVHKCLFIDPLKNIVKNVSVFLGKKPNPVIGKQHIIDDEYIKIIDSVNFTISHDDGQNVDDMDEADIIIIGPSRTSKSPTSIYLAHKGFKTANIPYVLNGMFLEDEKIKDIFVVGLSISPKILSEIRKNRLTALSERSSTEYVDMACIEDEIHSTKKLCAKNGWPVIDITNKSVEETAARIIQMYHSWREKHLK